MNLFAFSAVKQVLLYSHIGDQLCDKKTQSVMILWSKAELNSDVIRSWIESRVPVQVGNFQIEFLSSYSLQMETNV